MGDPFSRFMYQYQELTLFPFPARVGFLAPRRTQIVTSIDICAVTSDWLVCVIIGFLSREAAVLVLNSPNEPKPLH